MKRIAVWSVVITVIFAFVAVSFWDFTLTSRSAVVEYGESYLEAQSRANSDIVRLELTKATDQLELFARAATSFGQDDRDIYSLMESMCEYTSFDSMMLIGTDGIATSTLEDGLDVSDRDYFAKALNGQYGMTETFEGKGAVEGRRILMAYAPIYDDGVVRGVAAGAYYADTLSDLLAQHAQMDGFTVILNSSGRIIAAPLSKNSLIGKTSLQAFGENIVDSGEMTMKHLIFDEEAVTICVAPVDTFELAVATVTSYHMQNETMGSIKFAALVFMLKFVAAFVAGGLIVFAHIRRASKETGIAKGRLEHITNSIFGGVRTCDADDNYRTTYMSEGFLTLLKCDEKTALKMCGECGLDIILPQDRERVEASLAEPGSEKRNEYRVRRSDGQIIWVMDNGRIVKEMDGSTSYYSVITDITDSKNTEMNLRISNQRNQIAISHVADRMFEIDLKTDTLCVVSLIKATGRIPAIIENVPASLFEMNIISEDYAVEIGRMYTSLKEGAAMISKVIEMNFSGQMKWYRLTLSCVYDDNGAAVQAIGTISDVSRDVEAREALKRRAECDVLTGLYNRATLEEKYDAAFLSMDSAGCFHALFMIDLDEFKTINDTCGHITGDRVLVEFSKKLAALFRQSDTVARLGGDEFMVFMNSAHSIDIVERKANDICSMCSAINTAEMLGGCITCSVGACIIKDFSEPFEKYYKRSDKALYKAKLSGRNCYVIIDENETEHQKKTK
ncbi:MAG: diguanylate cyclase [Clostridia bacterium]|nr:diguanylate cyclase [Clostridia bacterium]